jgi:hypothetical protein
MTAEDLITEWKQWHIQNLPSIYQAESMARFVVEVVIPRERAAALLPAAMDEALRDYAEVVTTRVIKAYADNYDDYGH